MPLFLQSQFWRLYLTSNSQFSLSLSEIFSLPFTHWFSTSAANLNIMLFQITPPMVIFLIPGIYLSVKNRSKHSSTLILILLIPILLETLSARHPLARYLVSFLPIAVIYSALVVSRFPWLFVTLSIPIGFSLLQIISPSDYFIFLHRITKYSAYDTYVCCSSTGYPVNLALNYLDNLSEPQPLSVGVYLGVGNPPSAILAYYRSHPRIFPFYLDSQLMGNSLNNVDCLISKTPVYFLAIHEQQAGLNKYFQPVTIFSNPYGKAEYLTLYSLKEKCTGNTLDISLNLGH